VKVVKQEILKRLADIELEEDVAIFYACESVVVRGAFHPPIAITMSDLSTCESPNGTCQSTSKTKEM